MQLKRFDVENSLQSAMLMSYMARLHYSYDDRYLVTANFPGRRFVELVKTIAWLLSFAAAWNIGNESFMQSVKPISQLKPRVGYGQTGNQNIGAYAFADKLSVNGVYNFGSQRFRIKFQKFDISLSFIQPVSKMGSCRTV